MYAHIAFNLQKVIFGRMSYESFDVLKINISFTKMKNSCHYVFILLKGLYAWLLSENILTILNTNQIVNP